MTSRPPTTDARSEAPRSAGSRTESLVLRLGGRLSVVRGRLSAVEAAAPRAARMARAVIYPLALVLVGYMAYKAARRTDFSTIHYAPLGLSLVFAVLWWISLAAGWASLVDRPSAAAAWCRTQVARYLPGAIWALVTRASTVKGRIRHKVAAIAVENVVVLLVALAIGALFAAVVDLRWSPLVLLGIVPLVAAGWVGARANLRAPAIRRTAGVYAFGYLAYGAFNVLVQWAIADGFPLRDSVYVAAASCVAWAVGLVVVVAPGGVGVRELVYVWLLADMLPRDQLQAAAVASRLITVVAELLVLLVIAAPSLDRRRGRPAGAEQAPADERAAS